MNKKSSPLQKRLYMLALVCLLPLAVMILYLLYILNNFSMWYNSIVENITSISDYSIDFKEDMDYTMYMIVANMERAEQLVDTKQPHLMINKARKDFQALYDSSKPGDSKGQIVNILKALIRWKTA